MTQVRARTYFIPAWYSCSDFTPDLPFLKAAIPFAAARAAAVVVM